MSRLRNEVKLQRKVLKLLVSVDYPIEDDDEIDDEYYVDGNDSSTWL